MVNLLMISIISPLLVTYVIAVVSIYIRVGKMPAFMSKVHARGIYRYLPAFTGIYRRLLEFTGVY